MDIPLVVQLAVTCVMNATGIMTHDRRMAGPSLQSLPHDIIFHIVTFLGVLDLVSLQEVLPWLSDQSASYSLWAKVSRNSSLPRHPGPLPLADIGSHVSALQQSARIERAWAAARAAEASHPTKWIYSAMKGSGSQLGRKRTFDLSLRDSREGRFSLVFSRWLFVALIRKNLVTCHDLNALDEDLGTFTEVYRSKGAGVLHFACAESTALDGRPIAFAVVKETHVGSPLANFPFVIKVFKIEAPPFSSPTGISHVRLQEVLVRAVGWPGVTFTISLGPTLLLIADASKGVADDSVICMDAVSFERYQLLLAPALGLYTTLSITFVSCTTCVLVIRVFIRGIHVENEYCTSVIDAYNIGRPTPPNPAPRHPSSQSAVMRPLQRTHRGIADYFIRDAKLLEDSAYPAASAGVVPCGTAALRAFRPHSLDSKLTITTTFVGIRNVSSPLSSSFLGILRIELSPVGQDMSLSRVPSEGRPAYKTALPRTHSAFSTASSPGGFEPFGELAVDYTPLYILPAPLRLPFFQSTVNGSTRGILLTPSEDQAHETDAWTARSSPVLPIFEGISLRLNATEGDQDVGERNGDDLHPPAIAHHPAFQPLRPPVVPVRIDVTSLPYMLTIFPPTLLAFDGIRGRMVFLRLGALSPTRLEHRPTIEVWDC